MGNLLLRELEAELGGLSGGHRHRRHACRALLAARGQRPGRDGGKHDDDDEPNLEPGHMLNPPLASISSRVATVAATSKGGCKDS